MNEEFIAPTEIGLFLIRDHFDSIPLPRLFSDGNGCFIELGSELSAVVQEGRGWDGNVLNKCPGCGRRYFLTCDNQDCPLKKAYDEKKEKRKKS